MNKNMEGYKSYKGKKYLFILLCLTLAFLIGLVIMLLWNWLMPSIFNLGEITYWQAVGLLILSKILFGGGWFRGHHRGNRHWYMKRQFLKRCASMSDEEKKNLKEQFKSSFKHE